MTTSNNLYLLDTNILVYATDITSPFYDSCRTIRDKGLKGEIIVCVAPQVLLEFFAVVTSPKRVTKPMKSDKAIEEVQKYLEADKIIKIYPEKDTLIKALELAKEYGVKGQEVFDLQIVATMLTNEVTNIYTYDLNHFSKFKDINVYVP